MNTLLNIERSTKFTHLYHSSGKSIPVLFGGCVFSNKFTNYKETAYILSLPVYTYHSYYSVSSVIGDYIKKATLFKKANLAFHTIAYVGFLTSIIRGDFFL